MRRSKILATVLVLAGLAMVMTAGFSVFAAPTANQTLTFSNPVTANVSVGGATVDFGTITPDVASTSAPVSVTGSSNAEWTLTLSGTNFSDGTNTIPLGRLTVDPGTGSFAGIGGGLAITSAHAAGTGNFSVLYRLLVLNTDPGSPDGYNATLTYTISNS